MGVLKKARKEAGRRSGAQVVASRKRALRLSVVFFVLVVTAWILQFMEISVPGMAWYVYS